MDILAYVLAKNNAKAYTDQIKVSGLKSVETSETSAGTYIVAKYDLAGGTEQTITYEIPTIAGRGISNTVLNADYTLTITYTDGTTYTTPSIRGAQGATGAAGFSPVASVSKLGKVSTLTVTDATHTTTTTINDGSDVSVSASGTATDEVQYITIDGVEKKLAGGGSGAVSDVQINGTSILSSGVANIPLATSGNYGAIKLAVYDSTATPADGVLYYVTE